MSNGNLKEKHQMLTCLMSSNRVSTDIPNPNFAHVPILKFQMHLIFYLYFSEKKLGDVTCPLAFKLLHNNDNYKVGQMKANICDFILLLLSSVYV